MRGYVEAGRTFDLEENEDLIRCVAAPIRGAGGGIVAALSVSSAAQYMSDARMGGAHRRRARIGARDQQRHGLVPRNRPRWTAAVT